MFRELFTESDILSLPVVSMLFFMGVFAIVLVRTLSKRRKPHYDRMSRLPLEDQPEAPEIQR